VDIAGSEKGEHSCRCSRCTGCLKLSTML
jgi:hypothetical protein